ncbi:hypothetical protein FB548_1467 [Pseudoxanthomonas sp. 3HH-4]|uniref:hypothetical protein n=1 Tax=Pseudoxanthomonas sp. 3HH-4 TaxID=1690214 RepID=UPI00115117DC|nr:hypothetical protein [Pseudoxanthomonas sp. 3HH-4]TQM12621.1 hypothetical protein FB548_1467 [Pseudoxanthomonas sp. 3HH-4]
MQLKEFVSQALVDIIEGVRDAQGKVNLPGAQVNPHINSGTAELTKLGMAWASGRAAHLVRFDLAITATEGSGTKGGIGVLAGAINLGSSGQSNSENVTASRIQFAVPVTLPDAS